jgi:hypothetical protein
MLVILSLIQKIDEKYLVVVKNYTDKKVLEMLGFEIGDLQLELVDELLLVLEVKETSQNL